MPGKNKKKEGRKAMNPKMKMVAGPARVSVRMLTAEEIHDFGLDELKPPLTYGLVTSIGWNFFHTKEGLIIIFDRNSAIQIFSDTHIIEERMILAKFLRDREQPEPEPESESEAIPPFSGLCQESAF